MLESLGHINNLETLFAEGLPSFAHFTFDHDADYLKVPRTQRLQVLWFESGTRLLVSIFANSEAFADRLSGLGIEDFDRFIQANDLPVIDIASPLALSTVEIPKPWGAEIWYTGIEERGVCTVSGIPLPWLTDLLPKKMIGKAATAAPLLLKILAPLSDQDLGDLYFELHQKKIEVYIVTQIDPLAWPDGVGKIRYGFDPKVRAEFKHDDDFRAAYLDAVFDYRIVRTTIDETLDQVRNREGYALNGEVPSAVMKAWLNDIPSELAIQEAHYKAKMNRFTSLRDIQVGDVITVEPFFPHSLQHGVRVIEFQTASYERHILSFGQKVLTQDNWDTEAGLKDAILDSPLQRPLQRLPAPDGITVEVVADFKAFRALRISLSPGQRYVCDLITDYQILIGISGRAKIDELSVESESAFFLTVRHDKPFELESAEGAVVLIAQPR
jgi:hypothetical protein